VSDWSKSPLVAGAILPALATMAIGASGFLADKFTQYVLTQVVISTLVGATLVMIVGYGRVIMLATGAMMAIGAYGSAILQLRAGVSYLATLPASLGLGLLAGLVLAVPATRFRGHHLAMATIVFQYLVIIVIREWEGLTGGALGLRVPAVSFLGIESSSDLHWLLFIALASAVGTAIMGALLTTRFGKTLRAMSASEVAADAYGVHIPRFQIAAFALSSAMLAYAGALLAPGVRILDSESFGITHSIVALGYPIVGGINSVWGGLIGGGILRLLPEALRSLGKYQELWVALLAIAVMVINPAGILGIAQKLVRKKPAFAGVRPTRALPAEASATDWKAAPADMAVRVAGATKAYEGLVAVNDVTIEVPAGEIHGLIGPNGAGKTTLFNAISGFTRLDIGTISLFGAPVEKEPSRLRIRHGVTRTFQQVAVFGHLSCLDNVIIGLGQNGVTASLSASAHELFKTAAYRGSVERAYAALVEVGIGDLAHMQASELSLGNQRRLEIARAIVSQPRLILLDEPVSGVARSEEKRIAELLTRLGRDHGISMLVIEHNIGFVSQISHSISVMAAGRIIANGSPDAVLGLSEVRRRYFGEIDVDAA
jgi:branched-chain amino acid transport system permease protein